MTTNPVSVSVEHRFRSFGLSENPFHISPDPRFLFAGTSYNSTISELQNGVASRRGLMVLTGEAGTGKTTLMRYFLQWLGERRLSSCYIFHAHLDPASLFEFVLRDFGVPVLSNRRTDLIAALHRWFVTRDAAGDTPVLIIDEAQALPVRTLSELCLLLNLESTKGKLVQILLAGQPELDEKLHRPDLYALRQRIAVRCRLPVLTLEETGEYIRSRLRSSGAGEEEIFPAESVRLVYSCARGVPRVVNLVCENAMDHAYGEGKSVVTPAHVRRAAAQFDLAVELAKPMDVAAQEQTQVATPKAMEKPAKTEIPMVVEIVEPLSNTQAMPALATRPRDERRAEAIPLPAAAAAAIAAAPVKADSSAPALAPMAISTPAPTRQATGAAVAAKLELRTVRPYSDAPEAAAPPSALGARNAKSGLVEFCLDPGSAQETPKLVNGEWKKNRFDAEWRQYWRDVSGTFKRDLQQLKASIRTTMRSGVYEPLWRWLGKPIIRRQ